MSIEAVDDGAGMRVLVVHGEVDAAVAPELLSQLPQLLGEASDVVLDLTDVSFLDSGGLRLVDGLHRAACARGATFAVLAPDGSPARRLIDLVGMSALVLRDE